jgi:phage baseplate assembly protein W
VAADFGSDISTFPDLDELLEPQSGRRVLLESVARRMSTPRGALWWAPSYGSDLGAILDGPVSEAQLRANATALQQQLAQDERILSARVEASYVAATRSLRILVSITDADGPFERVFTLDSTGVATLMEAA